MGVKTPTSGFSEKKFSPGKVRYQKVGFLRTKRDEGKRKEVKIIIKKIISKKKPILPKETKFEESRVKLKGRDFTTSPETLS